MALSPKAQRRKRLRELLTEGRKAAGLSQAAVAKKVGKPQAFVSRYETGERQLDVAEFVEIAEVLGVDPVAILRTMKKS